MADTRRADLTDERVRIVWDAFKANGWIINSLPMAQVAIAALEDAAPAAHRRPMCPECGAGLFPKAYDAGLWCARCQQDRPTCTMEDCGYVLHESEDDPSRLACSIHGQR